jgi:uncharacterized membrane protein YdjX (TVP38/TMEM64 family)
MEESIKESQGKELNFWGLGITALIIIALVVFFDIESVKGWVERAGVWGPVVFILLKVSTIVIAPLSGSPLYPIVGLLFGFWPGILYVLIGDTIGYSASFWISRIFGKKIVSRFISDKEEGIMAKIIAHASTPRGFFHACLTLFAMPELLSYGAGLTKLSYWRVISIMVPITAIGSTLFVFIGSVLDPNGQSIWIGFGLPALGVAAVLIGGTLFARSMKNKPNLD